MRLDPQRAVVPGLIVGVAGLVCFAVAAILAPAVAVRSWLVSTLFFLGLSLGALIIVMIHNLTGGRWGNMIRPQLLAAVSALPWTVLAMAVPLLRSADVLAWTTTAPESLPETVRRKIDYFAPLFLATRTIVAVALWLLFAWAVATLPQRWARARTWSIAGLIVVMITTMFFTT